MGQDQAAEVGNLHLEAGFLALHVRPAEEDQRGGLAAAVVPVAFHRGDLHRLVLEGV
ncbi:hypothetical protein D3C71_2062020 [compost metagenome]